MGSNTLRQTESYTLTWQKVCHEELELQRSGYCFCVLQDEAGSTHWIGEYALKQETVCSNLAALFHDRSSRFVVVPAWQTAS